MQIKTLEDRCIGCGDCLIICPAGAINLAEGKAQIKNGCICCGACVLDCAQQAIEVIK